MKVRLDNRPVKEVSRMHLFDLQIDFFIPLWRRVVVVLICLVWAVFEFVNAAPMWGVVFGGIGAYALWQFFMCGWPGSITADQIQKNGSAE